MRTLLEGPVRRETPLRCSAVSNVSTSDASLDYGWNSFIVIATRGHKLDADFVLALRYLLLKARRAELLAYRAMGHRY